jgi:thiamine pyrophosphate-dependent acetolactate synthase large subunit-like protein
MAPVYINLDAEMQERKLSESPPPLDAARYCPPALSAPAPDALSRAADILRSARNPVILAGRASRSVRAWDERVELAERLQARVATDLKIGASFPTDHKLHVGAPSVFPGPEVLDALRGADAILSLDWVDLGGTLRTAFPGAMPAGKVIQVSLDHTVHNGWSMDHQALPAADLYLAADPDTTVPLLIEAVGIAGRAAAAQGPAPTFNAAPESGGPQTVEHLAYELRRAVGKRDVSLLHLPLSWNGAWWPFRHPLDFIGSDGGGGIGGGPGISVGAALALRDSGRLPVAICGDGDFLMGATALWTAAHYRIPLLFVIANNRSFYNDEVHQERVARMRERRVENKWIGQRIADPDVDIVKMARAQGAVGFGPLRTREELAPAFENAIRAVEAGSVAVVDVRVEPGYTPAMTASLIRSQE